MTFRIYPEKWDHLPDYRLREEFEEFLAWFGLNSGYMSKKEAQDGYLLVEKINEIIAEKNLVLSGRYYEEHGSSSEEGSQLTFIPTN